LKENVLILNQRQKGERGGVGGGEKKWSGREGREVYNGITNFGGGRYGRKFVNRKHDLRVL
jgi:hypothetical protein